MSSNGRASKREQKLQGVKTRAAPRASSNAGSAAQAPPGQRLSMSNLRSHQQPALAAPAEVPAQTTNDTTGSLQDDPGSYFNSTEETDTVDLSLGQDAPDAHDPAQGRLLPSETQGCANNRASLKAAMQPRASSSSKGTMSYDNGSPNSSATISCKFGTPLQRKSKTSLSTQDIKATALGPSRIGPPYPSIQEVEPSDPRFRNVLSYRRYRLLNQSSRMGPEVSRIIGVWTRLLEYVMGKHVFNGTKPVACL
eukprot:IDg6027t1